MRGHDEQTHHMFSYLSPEQRVPADGIVKLPTSARFSPWALSARVSVSRHT